MSAGLSGSYAFNGVNLTLQPSDGQWMERPNYGIDGSGHIIYSGVREFELSFDFISMNDFNQVLLAYDAVGTTGTVVVDLPKFHSTDDRFYSYSGCTLSEIVMGGPFFMGYPSSVKVKVMNIRAA